jgi:hypothetical protein
VAETEKRRNKSENKISIKRVLFISFKIFSLCKKLIIFKGTQKGTQIFVLNLSSFGAVYNMLFLSSSPDLALR